MEVNEVIKRQYRLVCDAVRRSDAAKHDVTLRERVRDAAVKLMISAPIEYGRKSEEIIWRKTYYEALQYFKAKREYGALKQYAVEQLLQSGIGAYHHLIVKLEMAFELHLLGYVDCSIELPGAYMKSIVLDNQAVTKYGDGDKEKIKTWAERAVHRCLIASGDLARYLHDLTGVSHHRLSSQRYYHQALILKPSLGQPFNQMGTLFNGLNHALNSIYCYIRCLLTIEPFEGSATNLSQLLDKNRQSLSKMTGNPSKEFVIRNFIILLEKMWNLNQDNIIRYANDFVSALMSCEEVISDDAIYHMFLSLLAIHEHLKLKDNQLLLTSASDLILILGNHILLFVHQRLCVKVCSSHPYNSSSDASRVGTPKDSASSGSQKETPVERVVVGAPDKKKTVATRVSQFRRRKANGVNGNSSDDDQLDGSDVEASRASSRSGSCAVTSIREALSTAAEREDSGDEDSQSCISSFCPSDFELDLSSSEDEQDDEVIYQGGSSMPESNGNVSPVSSANLCRDYSVDEALSLKQVVKMVSSETLLSAVKLFLDWVSEQETKKLSDDVLKNLVDVANLLLVVHHRVMLGSDSTIDLVKSRSKFSGEKLTTWRQDLPLPEDVHLGQLKKHLKTDTFEQRNVMATDGQKSIYRMECVVSGVFRSTKEVREDVVYEEEQFLLGDKLRLRMEALKQESPTINGQGDCKKAVMRSMAHAWLTHEVKDLESELNGTRRAQCVGAMTAYIVVDASVLCLRLNKVKQIINAKKSIVIIPTCVVSQLDEMKKESALARDSIRWIEGELRRGSRFLRAQRHNELLPISLIKYPRKKDKDAWQLFQILECCNHFASKDGGQERAADNLMVTLLYVADKNNLPANAATVGETIGVNLRDMDDFVSKMFKVPVQSKGRNSKKAG